MAEFVILHNGEVLHTLTTINPYGDAGAYYLMLRLSAETPGEYSIWMEEGGKYVWVTSARNGEEITACSYPFPSKGKDRDEVML